MFILLSDELKPYMRFIFSIDVILTVIEEEGIGLLDIFKLRVLGAIYKSQTFSVQGQAE